MPPSQDPSLRKRASPEKSTSPVRRTPAPTPAPSHAQSRPTAHTPKLLLALVSLSLSYYLYHTFVSSRSPTEPLADSYALCSREGARQIYTVDPENPRPECFLVHRDKFLFSGSLGA